MKKIISLQKKRRKKKRLSIRQSSKTILDSKRPSELTIINFNNINNNKIKEKEELNDPFNSKKRFSEKLNNAGDIVVYSNEKLDNSLKQVIAKDSNIEEENKDNKEEKKLSNFELNELEYEEAANLDKRTFIQIYLALIRREHLILFTFLSFNDYNIFLIKIVKFIFLIATDIAMNVFFFSDDSMHKLFISYGKYDFIQQIPQIVYSTIISQLLEVFLCYLTMTDKYIYQIKNSKISVKKNMEIFKCIKIKLFSFFGFTFALFFFYWYTVASFCSVYENTQVTFIKDSLISFIIGILYPFAIYLIPSSLRIWALKRKKSGAKYIYRLSDIIPFF
jgi:hypothetical protein